MITLECNYSKKLGLPQYSSHQFSITLKTEIADLGAVQTESARLYALLQQSVDASIQQTGFLPQANGGAQNGSGNGNASGRHETCKTNENPIPYCSAILGTHLQIAPRSNRCVHSNGH